MPQLIAALPAVELTPGMTVVLEAIDPTTGNAVAGVTVRNVSITLDKNAVLDLLPAVPSPVLLAHEPPG